MFKKNKFTLQTKGKLSVYQSTKSVVPILVLKGKTTLKIKCMLKGIIFRQMKLEMGGRQTGKKDT